MNETPVHLPVLPSSAVFDEQPTPDELLTELVLLDGTGTDPHLIGVTVAETQRAEGQFAVNDQRMAEWAMRRLAEASVRFDEDRRLYEGFVAQLDAWFERVSAPHRATIGFFTDHLEDYGRRWIETQPKSRPRSLPLPSGVVRTTTREAVAEIVDKETVLAWAVDNHPEIVQSETKKWVNVSDVRGLVEVRVDMDPEADELITHSVIVDKATGEVVPGLGVRAKHVDVKIVAEQP